MKCLRCSQTDVLVIYHVLPDGTEVKFFWCHSCEEKWWDRDGEKIDVTEVLEIVRRNRE